MKYLFFIFIFLSGNVLSQTSELNGMVVNGDDNTSLASASVFINNSSKGTLSNAEGKFKIEGITRENFELVISYSGFISVSIKITPENIGRFHTIKLFPRKQTLEAVSIMLPEKEGWEKWGKFFTEIFIGQSDFAGQCVIENPKALLFFNDKKRNVLRAYSNGSLIIRNKALGYIVKYQLEEFEYDFKKKLVAYFGYTGFQELKTRNGKKRNQWLKNRKEAYDGSLTHFMRSLYVDSIAEQGFEVREKIRLYNTDTNFNKIYSQGNTPKSIRTEYGQYVVRVPEVPTYKKQPDYIDLINIKLFSFKDALSFDSSLKRKEFYFENYLEVIYRNALAKMDYLLVNNLPKYLKMNQNSDIVLLSAEPLQIEKDGTYFNPVNMISSGYWGWFKMAEMLPADYERTK